MTLFKAIFLLLNLCFRFSNFGLKDKKVQWTFVFAFQILGSKIKRSSGPFYLGSIISVVGKSTVEIMEPFLV